MDGFKLEQEIFKVFRDAGFFVSEFVTYDNNEMFFMFSNDLNEELVLIASCMNEKVNISIRKFDEVKSSSLNVSFYDRQTENSGLFDKLKFILDAVLSDKFK